MALEVAVVTPEREVWSGEATFVSARAEGGEIGVLPGHAPFLGSLRHAAMKVVHADGEELVAVHGGFIEVFEDRVTVLTPLAELVGEIDVERARRSRERAEAALEEAEDAEREAAAREELARAEARLRVAGTDATE